MEHFKQTTRRINEEERRIPEYRKKGRIVLTTIFRLLRPYTSILQLMHRIIR